MGDIADRFRPFRPVPPSSRATHSRALVWLVRENEVGRDGACNFGSVRGGVRIVCLSRRRGDAIAFPRASTDHFFLRSLVFVSSLAAKACSTAVCVAAATAARLMPCADGQEVAVAFQQKRKSGTDVQQLAVGTTADAASSNPRSAVERAETANSDRRIHESQPTRASFERVLCIRMPKSFL